MRATYPLQATTMAHSLWRRPLTLVLICLSVAGVAMLLIGRYQLQAYWAFQQHITTLRSSGIPVDNATMEANFIANTSRSGTAAWNEIRGQLNNEWISLMAADLPYVGTTEQTPENLAGQMQQDKSLIEGFLARVAPSLAKLHATLDAYSDTPIWEPIHFDGYQTLLGPVQEPRSIMRLLLLDFHYALHTQDKERALRDLKSMRGLAEAFRWEAFIVVDLVYLGHLDIYRQAIQTSLSMDFWTAKDIPILREMVGESRDMAKVWPKVIAGERAWALASMQSEDFPELLEMNNTGLGNWAALVWKLPSVRHQHLMGMERIATLPVTEWEKFRKESKELEEQLSISMSGMLTPAISSLAEAYARSEDTRKLTVLGLATKSFKLSQQRFPDSLRELITASALPITDRDLQTVTQQPFGYSIEGEAGYLWNARLNSQILGNVIPNQPVDYDPATRQAKDRDGNTVYGQILTVR